MSTPVRRFAAAAAALNAVGVTIGFSLVAALLVAIGRAKPMPKKV
jgi:hypothetical protein